MRKYENNCVGCPTEMGCLGNSCKYMNVPIDYCDECGDCAMYRVDHLDLCENCTKLYLQETFDNLSEEEKAEKLGICLIEIGGN